MACAAGSAGIFATKEASSSAIKNGRNIQNYFLKKFYGLINVRNLHENHKKTKKTYCFARTLHVRA